MSIGYIPSELGQGFSFIARQKRMSIGADDYYLDLLFNLVTLCTSAQYRRAPLPTFSDFWVVCPTGVPTLRDR